MLSDEFLSEKDTTSADRERTAHRVVQTERFRGREKEGDTYNTSNTERGKPRPKNTLSDGYSFMHMPRRLHKCVQPATHCN